MRVAVLTFVGLVGLALVPGSAGAFPPAAGRVEADANRYIVEIAQGCGPGFHWVGKHRNRYGRWVPGHCARN